MSHEGMTSRSLPNLAEPVSPSVENSIPQHPEHLTVEQSIQNALNEQLINAVYHDEKRAQDESAYRIPLPRPLPPASHSLSGENYRGIQPSRFVVNVLSFILLTTFLADFCLWVMSWHFLYTIEFITSGKAKSDNAYSTIVKKTRYVLLVVNFYVCLMGGTLIYVARCFQDKGLRRYFIVGFWTLPIPLADFFLSCLLTESVRYSEVRMTMQKVMLNYSSDKEAQKTWDFTHAFLRCCGVRSYKDWREKDPDNYIDVEIPYSCCKGATPIQANSTRVLECQRRPIIPADRYRAQPTILIWEDGCLLKVLDLLQTLGAAYLIVSSVTLVVILGSFFVAYRYYKELKLLNNPTFTYPGKQAFQDIFCCQLKCRRKKAKTSRKMSRDTISSIRTTSDNFSVRTNFSDIADLGDIGSEYRIAGIEQEHIQNPTITLTSPSNEEVLRIYSASTDITLDPITYYIPPPDENKEKGNDKVKMKMPKEDDEISEDGYEDGYGKVSGFSSSRSPKKK